MFDSIADRYRRNGALVDTNLFVLLLVGRYDRSKIPNFRATQKYGEYVYSALENLLAYFAKLHTTINITTEVDNLSRQVGKGERAGISRTLAELVDKLHESAFESRQLVHHPFHGEIGIADCSILEMADRDILVVTDDLPLTIILERNRRAVINLSRYLLDG
jgi:hypothetical protein